MFKIFKRLTTKELIMIVLAVIFVCLNNFRMVLEVLFPLAFAFCVLKI